MDFTPTTPQEKARFETQMGMTGAGIGRDVDPAQRAASVLAQVMKTAADAVAILTDAREILAPAKGAASVAGRHDPTVDEGQAVKDCKIALERVATELGTLPDWPAALDAARKALRRL